jgi:DNA-3-methyladenine glycosylase I
VQTEVAQQVIAQSVQLLASARRRPRDKKSHPPAKQHRASLDIENGAMCRSQLHRSNESFRGAACKIRMLELRKKGLRNDHWRDAKAQHRGGQARRLSAPAQSAQIEMIERCSWPKSELDIAYHDAEWGVPVHDDRLLFEFLILEGAQAGLSWSTILNKRANYRRAFADFDAQRVARFTPARVEKLMQDEGIVRNRLKIDSAITNARAFLAVQKEFGSFDKYVWRFVGGKPKQNARRTLKQIPARTTESDALSKDLQRRGFRFVGSTICYAFMQAVGMVNDHLTSCYRYRELT